MVNRKFVSLLKKYIAAISFLAVSSAANAAFDLYLLYGTGGDDLRGGNAAFVDVVLTDGTRLGEKRFSSGDAHNTDTVAIVSYGSSATLGDIRSIIIRHGGDPRSGEPFDMPDNWDLESLTVLHSSAEAFRFLYQSERDSNVGNIVHRFDGSHRSKEFFIKPIGTEPDFIVTRVASVATGNEVTVKNVGLGAGTLDLIVCKGSRETVSRFVGRRLARDGTQTHRITAPLSGSGSCWPVGRDLTGNPELVTSNNVKPAGF